MLTAEIIPADRVQSQTRINTAVLYWDSNTDCIKVARLCSPLVEATTAGAATGYRIEQMQKLKTKLEWRDMMLPLESERLQWKQWQFVSMEAYGAVDAGAVICTVDIWEKDGNRGKDYWEIPVQNQEACRIQYMDYLEWRVQMCDSLPITQGVIDAQ
jgi:hypothetical protein|tara:strand:+ start:181 stop:651 length:471 start_codon:yes stop_codon:yes gene_type:complete